MDWLTEQALHWPVFMAFAAFAAWMWLRSEYAQAEADKATTQLNAMRMSLADARNAAHRANTMAQRLITACDAAAFTMRKGGMVDAAERFADQVSQTVHAPIVDVHTFESEVRHVQ